MHCPSDEIRLAFLHGLLVEMVDDSQLFETERHLNSCEQCHQWSEQEKSWDAQLRRVDLVQEAIDVEAKVFARLRSRRRWLCFAAVAMVSSLVFLVASFATVTAVSVGYFGFAKVLAFAHMLVETTISMVELVPLYLQAISSSIVYLTQAWVVLCFIVIAPLVINIIKNRHRNFVWQKGV